MWKRSLCFVGMVVLLGTLVAFWHRMVTPEMNVAGVDAAGVGLFLAAQANHYSLLQIYLVTFSLGLAVAALLGYEGIKRVIANRVDVRVRETMPEAIRQHLKQLGTEEWGRIATNDKMTGETDSGRETMDLRTGKRGGQ